VLLPETRSIRSGAGFQNLTGRIEDWKYRALLDLLFSLRFAGGRVPPRPVAVVFRTPTQNRQPLSRMPRNRSQGCLSRGHPPLYDKMPATPRLPTPRCPRIHSTAPATGRTLARCGTRGRWEFREDEPLRLQTESMVAT